MKIKNASFLKVEKVHLHSRCYHQKNDRLAENGSQEKNPYNCSGFQSMQKMHKKAKNAKT